MAERESPEGYIYTFALHRGLERRPARPTIVSVYGPETTVPVARQSFLPVDAATVSAMSPAELKFVAAVISDGVAKVFGDAS